MSRKKKYRESFIGLPDRISFQRLKYNLHNEVLPAKMRTSLQDRWVDKTNKAQNWSFPYATRRKEVLDITGPSLCACHHRQEQVPKWWTDAWGTIERGDKYRDAAIEMMLSVNDDDWTAGKIPKKSLAKFRKTIKERKLLPSQGIQRMCKDLLEYKKITDSWITGAAFDCVNTFHNRAIKSTSDTRIYLSCDPYDVCRMGSGKPDVKSCLAIFGTKHGDNSNDTPEYMADPNLFVCYAESESEHWKPFGIRARIIVRAAMSPIGPVIVPDRLYGSVEYLPSMIHVLRRETVAAGYKLAWFERYLNIQKNSTRQEVMRDTKTYPGYSRPFKHAGKMPHFDQGSSADWVNLSTAAQKVDMLTYKLKVEINEKHKV